MGKGDRNCSGHAHLLITEGHIVGWGWLLVGTRQPAPQRLKENMNKQIIEALLTEREGYVRRNLPDRVKQVDEALRHAGYTADKPATVETATADPVAERAAKPVTRKRAIG